MTNRTPEDATPILPAPTFDSEDLTTAVGVLSSIAATYPDADAAQPVILRAAINLALERTSEMLAANGCPVDE